MSSDSQQTRVARRRTGEQRCVRKDFAVVRSCDTYGYGSDDDPMNGGEHERATCPECQKTAVTVMVAPMKPPKMECTDCGWDSLDRHSAADVLADITGRDRSEFVPDDVEYPPLEELEVVESDE